MQISCPEGPGPGVPVARMAGKAALQAGWRREQAKHWS